MFGEVAWLLGLQNTRTTPLHSQSNGMVERFNFTKNQKDWDKRIPLFLMAYRLLIYETTGDASQSYVWLWTATSLRPWVWSRSTPTTRCPQKLRSRLQKVLEVVRDKLEIASKRMKACYDLGAVEDRFNMGDLVRFYNPQRRKGKESKTRTQRRQSRYCGETH